MKKNLIPLLLISSLITLQGCATIEGILKAGMWVAILAIFVYCGTFSMAIYKNEEVKSNVFN